MVLVRVFWVGEKVGSIVAAVLGWIGNHPMLIFPILVGGIVGSAVGAALYHDYVNGLGYLGSARSRLEPRQAAEAENFKVCYLNVYDPPDVLRIAVVGRMSPYQPQSLRKR